MDYHKNAPWTAVSRERLAQISRPQVGTASPPKRNTIVTPQNETYKVGKANAGVPTS